MFRLFNDTPSKWLTRIFLLVGMPTFIAVYSYMMRLFSNMGIEADEFNTVWLSFDVIQFQSFIQKLSDLGQLEIFLSTFKFNIVSITGFMLAFFSIGLMLARQIPSSSRLFKTAFLFPLFAAGVAVIDIGSSLLVLACGTNLPQVSTWMVYTISASYIGRVLLLYALLIWFVVAGINILLRKRSKHKI